MFLKFGDFPKKSIHVLLLAGLSGQGLEIGPFLTFRNRNQVFALLRLHPIHTPVTVNPELP